jgi:hypothetical protein
VQVLDRFHLVHNLRQAVEAFLANQRPALQAAAACTAMALTPAADPIPVTPVYRGRRRSPKPMQPREGGTTWRNGITEGQIDRLKLLKRLGHGRAGFALWRQRVLQPT